MHVHQLRKSGHSREVIIAAVSIVAVLLVSVLAVSVFKKPGQMGVIESQSMDMSKITPPEGAVPVAVDTARVGSIEGHVTYTGTVQALNDEDIFPRVTGKITRMLVYPGDHVRAGQLLAILDPANSEYAAKAQQSSYEAQAAQHAIAIAKRDYQEKQHQSAAAVDAQTMAAKSLDEAKANLDYWATEIAREKTLLGKAVVSQQEYHNELAQYQTAQAKLSSAQASVRHANHDRIAAEEAAASMYEHIHHRTEEAKAAQAAATQARIIESYTRITASGRGVVTKRDVSPGVVVSPSTRIMRIEQIGKVRLQAQVAASEINKIQLGAPVQVKESADSKEVINAKVTARFPAADPTSRTSVIEALVPNTNERLLPGQFVVMDISIGSHNALTIPTSAIVYSGDSTEVWKAVGSQESKTAVLTNVQIGLSNAERTEILSGLKDGDEVIYRGQEALQPNNKVIAVDWGPNGPLHLPTGAQAASNRLSAGNHWKVTLPVKEWIVTASMQPIPLKANANKLVINVKDKTGRLIDGAEVTAKTDMPTMSMPGPDLKANAKGSGIYEFASDFMATLWDVELSIKLPGGTAGTTKLEVEVP